LGTCSHAFSMIVLLFFHNFNSYFVNSEVRSSLAFPEGLPTKEVRSTITKTFTQKAMSQFLAAVRYMPLHFQSGHLHCRETNGF
ncbi:hypothetical protein, partial [Reichenbachiella sp. MALMAid0571]|uniref:hypothetical protein n=1 Tax=Reichenbachiella sp. MALMAid0571 TaxID=3143939 RepID=UPI0032DEF958